jgi:hypothetical protein
MVPLPPGEPRNASAGPAEAAPRQGATSGTDSSAARDHRLAPVDRQSTADGTTTRGRERPARGTRCHRGSRPHRRSYAAAASTGLATVRPAGPGASGGGESVSKLARRSPAGGSSRPCRKDNFGMTCPSEGAHPPRSARLKLAESLAMATPALARRDVRLPGIAGKAVAVIGVRRGGKTPFLARCRAERIQRGRPAEAQRFLSLEDGRLSGLTVAELRWLLEEHARQRPGLHESGGVTVYLGRGPARARPGGARAPHYGSCASLWMAAAKSSCRAPLPGFCRARWRRACGNAR